MVEPWKQQSYNIVVKYVEKVQPARNTKICKVCKSINWQFKKQLETSRDENKKQLNVCWSVSLVKHQKQKTPWTQWVQRIRIILVTHSNTQAIENLISEKHKQLSELWVLWSQHMLARRHPGYQWPEKGVFPLPKPNVPNLCFFLVPNA